MHSSYVYPVEVVIEKAMESEALYHSNIYVLGEVTTNNPLVEKWLKGSELKVVQNN